jgi:hypothetical protein
LPARRASAASRWRGCWRARVSHASRPGHGPLQLPLQDGGRLVARWPRSLHSGRRALGFRLSQTGRGSGKMRAGPTPGADCCRGKGWGGNVGVRLLDIALSLEAMPRGARGMPRDALTRTGRVGNRGPGGPRLLRKSRRNDGARGGPASGLPSSSSARLRVRRRAGPINGADQNLRGMSRFNYVTGRRREDRAVRNTAPVAHC